jgi:hypothetical protein
MAFIVSTDRDGIHSIGTSSATADLWAGPSVNGRNDIDWHGVARGRVIVVAEVFRPRHLPQVYHQRPDGLFEMAFVRVKVVHDHGHEFPVPVFASTLDPNKQTTRVHGPFAFADDLAAVHELVQFRARDAATRNLAHLFNTYAEAARKERQAEQRRLRQQEREQELRQRAEAAGVAYEDLVEGMEIWNRIRRHRYGPRRCFCCGRLLTDPGSIVSGIGPECIRRFPALMAAAKAKVLDLGRLRFDADRLLARFEQAGMADLAAVVRDARAHEQLVASDAE